MEQKLKEMHPKEEDRMFYLHPSEDRIVLSHALYWSMTLPQFFKSKLMTAILHYPCAKRRNKYTIPERVTTIADDCFSHARHLEHITLPDGLTQLGGSAFAFCKKLKRMHIPDGVRVIPSYAFFCCESLTELQLPERMEGLGAEAFTFCPLTEF